MCYMFENVITKPSNLYAKNVITITGINPRLLKQKQGIVSKLASQTILASFGFR